MTFQKTLVSAAVLALMSGAALAESFDVVVIGSGGAGLSVRNLPLQCCRSGDCPHSFLARTGFNSTLYVLQNKETDLTKDSRFCDTSGTHERCRALRF